MGSNYLVCVCVCRLCLDFLPATSGKHSKRMDLCKIIIIIKFEGHTNYRSFPGETTILDDAGRLP